MSKLLRLIRRDERGAAAIEMAIAVPVLTLFLWGIFQVGIAFQASAGMQHAVGEGARFATLCYPTTAGACATPSNSAIQTKISSKTFGTGVGNFNTPSVTTPAASVCTNCRLLSVTFTMPMNFLFFNGPSVNLTRTKIVYLAT